LGTGRDGGEPLWGGAGIRGEEFLSHPVRICIATNNLTYKQHYY